MSNRVGSVLVHAHVRVGVHAWVRDRWRALEHEAGHSKLVWRGRYTVAGSGVCT